MSHDTVPAALSVHPEPARSVDAPNALRTRADLLFAARSWFQAGLLYQKLTSLIPDDLEAWRRRVTCARHLNQDVMTELILEDATTRHPEWKDALDETVVVPTDPSLHTPREASGKSLRKSCMMIENGLFFSTNKLRVCCTSHHDVGAPVICEYKGGPFPFDKILSKRAEIKEANRNGVHPACDGCPHLREDMWPDEPSHPFGILFIGTSAVCHLKCNYCFTVLEPEKVIASDYDPFPIVQEMLRTQSLAPDSMVFWAGGEPTMFRRFDELFRLLTAYGNVRHQIYTSGVRVSHSVLEALRMKRALVVCSMDAGTPQTYAAIKGRDWFHRVVDTCTHYAATGGDFRLKYLCLKDNSRREDLDGFLAIARRLKVKAIFCDVDYADRSDPCPEVVEALAYLTAQAKLSGIEVDFEAASKTVPERQLPQRILDLAHQQIRDGLSREKRLYALNEDAAGSRLTSAHDVAVVAVAETEGVQLKSTGDDPYLLLPKVDVPSGHRAFVSLEITASQDDLLEIYYNDEKNSEYGVDRTLRIALKTGRQQVILPAFPLSGTLSGRIRLDPGCFAGRYHLHQLEIHAEKVVDA